MHGLLRMFSVAGVALAVLSGAVFDAMPPAEAALAREAAVRAAPARAFGWPLQPAPAVSRPFQPPTRPYGPGHRGADLVGVNGQPVLSAGAGVVVYAAPLAGRGVVSVDHEGGLRTTYEPVRATVRAGQLLRRGEPLGTLGIGHPGCPVAACLHWGLRRGNGDAGYLDPLMLVRPGHVRLLPWPPADPSQFPPEHRPGFRPGGGPARGSP